MNLSNIVLRRDREITRLHYGAVDMLTPVLSHLLFVDNPQKFCHELWIDCQKLNGAIPNAKNLISDEFNISSD